MQSLIAVENLEPRKMLTTLVSNDVPKDILDGATILSTLDVPLTGKTLVDVNVTLTIRHTTDRDLDIFLIAPDGRSVELCTGHGWDEDNFTGTTFDDDGFSLSSGFPPYSGVFRPEGSLSVMRGMDPAGTWQLKVTDDAGDGTGTLVSWSLDLSTKGSAIVSITQVLPDPRNISVDSLDVVLTHPLRLSSFTSADVTLTRNGTEVPLDERITISSVGNSNTYRIQGLDPFTSTKGIYQLTVSVQGLVAQDGGLVYGNVTDYWMLQGSSLVSLSQVSPNPRNTPVSELIATFSDPVNLTTFSRDDFKLRRNGDLVPLTDSLTITRIGQSSRYRISGLETFTNRQGSYVLALSTRRIIDEQGFAAEESKTVAWSFTGPQVSEVTVPIFGTINTPVDTADVSFLFRPDLTTFGFNDVALHRNGVAVPLNSSVVIAEIGETNTYRISGLSAFTKLIGDYRIEVFGTGIQDLQGSIGGGSDLAFWRMSGPVFSSLVNPPNSLVNQSVNSIDVRFLYSPAAETFDVNDVKLTLNNIPVALSDEVVVTPLDTANTFRISGLDSFTQRDGAYWLSVNGIGMSDLYGNRGFNTLITGWTMDATRPDSVEVISVTPDPRVGRNRSLTSMTVVFNERVVPSSVSLEDFSLQLNGGPNLLDERVAISSSFDGKSWTLSNLRRLTGAAGDYKFRVSGSFADSAGNIAALASEDTWKVIDLPFISSYGRTRVYREDWGPIRLMANPLVSDADSTSFPGGSLTVRMVETQGNNRLAVLNLPNSFSYVSVDGNQILFQGTVIGVKSSGNNAPLVVQLNANATPVALSALLRSITFQSPGEQLAPSTRNVRFELSDGTGATGVANVAVVIAPVDDPAVIVTTSPVSYGINGDPRLLAPQGTIQDPDSIHFTDFFFRARIIKGLDGTETLGLGAAFTVVDDAVRFQGTVIGRLENSAGARSTLVVRLNGNATVNTVQSLLRSITFRTTGSTSLARRTVGFALEFSLRNTNMASIDIDVL